MKRFQENSNDNDHNLNIKEESIRSQFLFITKNEKELVNQIPLIETIGVNLEIQTQKPICANQLPHPEDINNNINSCYKNEFNFKSTNEMVLNDNIIPIIKEDYNYKNRNSITLFFEDVEINKIKNDDDVVQMLNQSLVEDLVQTKRII